MQAIVTFRDCDPLYKRPFYNVSWSDHNKIGYVSKSRWVIYPLWYSLGKTRFTTIEKKAHTLVPLSTLSGMNNLDNIDRFFTENRANHKLFFQGVLAIGKRDNSFFDDPIKLPLLNEISAEEFESKWEQLIPLLRPSDSIMTFDTRSIVSRAITVLDHGIWSHTACYIGNGQIIEATVSGVVERSINAYRSRQYRIGVYQAKAYDGDPENTAKYIALLRSRVGRPYGYRDLFIVGISKILRLDLEYVDLRYMSPNDLAINPNVSLVFTI